MMMLRQRMVLELLQLVSRRHVPELFATMVVQNCARSLLMMPRTISYNDCVRRWHRHRTHAHRNDVRRSGVDTDRMVLGHRRNDNILHNLTELRRGELTHRHRWHSRLAHVRDDDLLVAALVIELRSWLLHKHLPLANCRRSFLSRVLGLLTLALRRLSSR